MAAEHGIHASALRAMMQAVGFRPNSTMLTPAFTPDMILEMGMEVGMLGTYLGGCVKAPAAPCGGTVSFGPLLPMLTGQSVMGSNSSTPMSGGSGTGGATPTLTPYEPTSSPAPFVPSENLGVSTKAGLGFGVAAVTLALLLI